MKIKQQISIFNMSLILTAIKDSFVKLSPLSLIKNQVIFIVGIGALLTTIIVAGEIFSGNLSMFNVQIAIWL
jgi:potassium-transporting ATPase ATP-binding subunit